MAPTSVRTGEPPLPLEGVIRRVSSTGRWPDRAAPEISGWGPDAVTPLACRLTAIAHTIARDSTPEARDSAALRWPLALFYAHDRRAPPGRPLTISQPVSFAQLASCHQLVPSQRHGHGLSVPVFAVHEERPSCLTHWGSVSPARAQKYQTHAHDRAPEHDTDSGYRSRGPFRKVASKSETPT